MYSIREFESLSNPSRHLSPATCRFLLSRPGDDRRVGCKPKRVSKYHEVPFSDPLISGPSTSTMRCHICAQTGCTCKGLHLHVLNSESGSSCILLGAPVR